MSTITNLQEDECVEAKVGSAQDHHDSDSSDDDVAARLLAQSYSLAELDEGEQSYSDCSDESAQGGFWSTMMVRARLRQQRADEANKHSSNYNGQTAVNHRIEGDEECIYGEVKSATIEDFAGPAEGLALVHRPLLRKTGEVEEYKQEPSDPTESKPKLRKRKAGKNKSRTRKA